MFADDIDEKVFGESIPDQFNACGCAFSAAGETPKDNTKIMGIKKPVFYSGLALVSLVVGIVLMKKN